MKKHNLDIFLKKSKVIWKKNITKDVEVNVNITAGNAIKKPPLSTTLTILGVNVDNFIKEFNAKTAILFGTEELILSTNIIITPAKTTKFKFKFPTIYNLYIKIFKNSYWDLNIPEIFSKKIVSRIFYKLALASINILTEKAIHTRMRQLFGTATSWDRFKLATHSKDKKRHKKKK